MLNLIGLIVAFLVAAYTTGYGLSVWRKEQNPLGGIVILTIALACLALPVYILYFLD